MTHSRKSTTPERGFWKVHHDELYALLARRDLSWETVRVYLAVADLTLGYGKAQDVVSIGQIAEAAGMFTPDSDGGMLPDYAHVARALKNLTQKGLCGCSNGAGQARVRWVTWPVPPLAAQPRATATLGSSATASPGSTYKTPRSKARETPKTKETARGENAAAPAVFPDSAIVQPTTETATASTKEKGNSPDPRIRTFLDFFCKATVETLGRPYVIEDKDEQRISDLLLNLDDQGLDALAELQRATTRRFKGKWTRFETGIYSFAEDFYKLLNRKRNNSAHVELVKHWCTCWKGLYHGDYPFNGRDGKHVKELLRIVGGNLARAIAILDDYLACPDKWYVERRHGLKYLIGYGLGPAPTKECRP